MVVARAGASWRLRHSLDQAGTDDQERCATLRLCLETMCGHDPKDSAPAPILAVPNFEAMLTGDIQRQERSVSPKNTVWTECRAEIENCGPKALRC